MRYLKQELFKNIGKEGQKLLKKSYVTIVGLGATGSNSANLLARAGVNLRLIDKDLLELENLQRTNLFNEKDIGKPKALQAKKHLKLINKDIKIKVYFKELNSKNINLIKSSLVLDCTDNLKTRFLINEYCVKNDIKWIYSGIVGSRGMVLVIDPKKFCFNCVFKKPTDLLATCHSEGVLNTNISLISAIQVNEALKILCNKKYCSDLIYFDIWDLNFKKIKIKRNKNCEVCSKIYK